MKNTNRDPLTEKVRTVCGTYGFYRTGEKTLVGFSGGADSVCLLHVLLRLLGREHIAAVHINHMLRGADADADEAFCRDFCAASGIPFFVKHVDIAALCGGTGIEEAARQFRYRIFSEEAEKAGCSTVSLAHTASDNLETMIFYLCRGAGLSGLSGIPPMRGMGGHTVVRPLITCTKEEILRYLRENELSFRTDASNFDTSYTRNFIRHNIIPYLKEVNPAAEENAFAAATAAADAKAFLREEAKRFLVQYVSSGAVPAGELARLSPAVFYETVEILYQNAGGSTLSRSQAEAIRALVLGSKKGKRIALSDGLCAAMDGDMLKLLSQKEFEDNQAAPEFSICLKSGKNILPGGNLLYIDAIPSDRETAQARFFSHTRLPAEALASLYAKSRKPGMHYRTGGMTRTLKKFLCGAGADVKRYRPVICRDSSILWFPGLGAADGLTDEKKSDLYYLEF